MNTKEPSKQPQPSYEEGKFRDPKITAMQDEGFRRDKFLAVVKKAATSVEKQARTAKGSHDNGD